MKSRTLLLLIYAFVFSGCGERGVPSKAPVIPVTENYFGVEITDSYRYMENMDDTVFLDWMKEYADYTRRVLDEIPGRASLIEKMVEFDQRRSETVHTLNITNDGKYFYLKMTPGDETSKLFWRENYTGEEYLLYDPLTFSKEAGTSFVINSFNPDFDGKKVGVTVSPNGSENQILIIIDVESGKVQNDTVRMIAAGIEWMKGGNQFFYLKYNSDNVHDLNRAIDTKVYLHTVGEPQSLDKVAFSSDLYPSVGMRPQQLPYIVYDHYGEDYYLILYTVERFNIVFRSSYYDPKVAESFSWQPLIRMEDKIQDYYVKGKDIYLYTAKDAPGFEIIKTSKLNPDIPAAEIVVPEQPGGKISAFAFTNEALYYSLNINGVEERLYRLDEDSKSSAEIVLPANAGSLNISTRGYKFPDVWVSISGWTLNGKRYRYDPDEGSFTHEQLSSIAEYPEYDEMVVEEVMVPSHDGERVPLSIIYQKGTPLDGTAPLLINGYGAYGISSRPVFNPFKMIWTLKGGILATAHVRGGGELGEAWRLGGFKTTKPNTWKDMIACAEYLHENKYSAADHTAIIGGSAGGILIGRSMTDRPDLFAAAMPMVGAMNTLRGEDSPNGPVNVPEFGSKNDSVECLSLIEMDSYLKIRDGVKYPATLVTAGFNDPRVIVWQPAKFAARLQAANASGKAILFDVDYSSGHGVGDMKSKAFEDLADIIAFGLWQTGHPEFQ